MVRSIVCMVLTTSFISLYISFIIVEFCSSPVGSGETFACFLALSFRPCFGGTSTLSSTSTNASWGRFLDVMSVGCTAAVGSCCCTAAVGSGCCTAPVGSGCCTPAPVGSGCCTTAVGSFCCTTAVGSGCCAAVVESSKKLYGMLRSYLGSSSLFHPSSSSGLCIIISWESTVTLVLSLCSWALYTAN